MRIATATIVSPLELPYLREWVCHHMQMGITDFWMGLNDFTEAELFDFHCILADLIQSRHVHPFRMDGLSRQLPCNIQALHMANAVDIDWMFLIDIDEFIKIRSDRTLEQILDDHKDHPAISFHWRLFGDSGHEHQSPLPVQDRFRMCERSLNHHLKTAVNLKWFRTRGIHLPGMINPHFVQTTTILAGTGRQTFGPFDEIDLDRPMELELSHYSTKSKDECRIRREYRRCDTGEPNKDGWLSFYNSHNKNEIDSEELKWER